MGTQLGPGHRLDSFCPSQHSSKLDKTAVMARLRYNQQASPSESESKQKYTKAQNEHIPLLPYSVGQCELQGHSRVREVLQCNRHGYQIAFIWGHQCHQNMGKSSFLGLTNYNKSQHLVTYPKDCLEDQKKIIFI